MEMYPSFGKKLLLCSNSSVKFRFVNSREEAGGTGLVHGSIVWMRQIGR